MILGLLEQRCSAIAWHGRRYANSHQGSAARDLAGYIARLDDVRTLSGASQPLMLQPIGNPFDYSIRCLSLDCACHYTNYEPLRQTISIRQQISSESKITHKGVAVLQFLAGIALHQPCGALLASPMRWRAMWTVATELRCLLRSDQIFGFDISPLLI